jgi:hypothetical protein
MTRLAEFYRRELKIYNLIYSLKGSISIEQELTEVGTSIEEEERRE